MNTTVAKLLLTSASTLFLLNQSVEAMNPGSTDERQGSFSGRKPVYLPRDDGFGIGPGLYGGLNHTGIGGPCILTTFTPVSDATTTAFPARNARPASGQPEQQTSTDIRPEPLPSSSAGTTAHTATTGENQSLSIPAPAAITSAPIKTSENPAP